MLPESVERLFEVMQVRVLAKICRLHTVEAKGHAVLFTFQPNKMPAEPVMQQLMDRYARRLRFPTPTSVELQLPSEDWSVVFRELTVALQTMQLCGTKPEKPYD